MSRKPPDPDLASLPPIARAEAMDRPYRPGRARRQVLLGVVVVSALVMLFLSRMPHGDPAPPRTGVASRAEPTPGVVYQNLRAAPVENPPKPSAQDDAQHP